MYAEGVLGWNVLFSCLQSPERTIKLFDRSLYFCGIFADTAQNKHIVRL